MSRIHFIRLLSNTTLLAFALSLVKLTTAAATHPPARAPNDIVDLGYAKYRGNLSYSDTVAYLGLPYAEPPLGGLRFRAPVALNTTRVREETGGEIVDASRFPDKCVQGSPTGE